MKTKEQKLVDICFDLVLTCLRPESKAFFEQKTDEEKANWVREQLKACGIDTTPIGASFGVLKD